MSTHSPSDEELLTELRCQLREDVALAPIDKLLESLAYGELSEGEAISLQQQVERDEQLLLTAELLRPISAERRARYTTAVLETLQQPPVATAAEASAERPAEPSPLASLSEHRARTSQAKGPRRGAAWAALPALAAAAAVALVLRSPPESGRDEPAVPELQAYALEVRSGFSEKRSAAPRQGSAPAVFSRARTPELILRPQRSGQRAPQALVFAVSGTKAQPIEIAAEARNGSLRLRLSPEALATLPEQGTLAVALLPAEGETDPQRSLAEARSAGAQLFEIPYNIDKHSVTEH